MKTTNSMDIISENNDKNEREASQNKIKLASTPRYLTIGTHSKCNADCVFCLGGDYPSFDLKIYKNLFEKKLGEALKKADHIGFCGFGEIFLMPDFLFFLNYINITLPDNTKVFTTNGIYLKPEVCEILTSGKYSLIISLHASNKELHESLVRTKSFDKIIANIKNLVKLKKQKNSTLHINLMFLLTRYNLEDLPKFVALAKELGVDRVTCNHINIFNPDHLKMSCFFMQDRTNEIFDISKALAEKLGVVLILPPKFNSTMDGTENNRCLDPWNFFYVETQGSVNPCCYAGDHIGYLNKEDFDNIWNGEGYTSLRKGLVSGKIHSWCKYCFKHDPKNMNDIRSHITFRPETQKEIIEYLKKHKDEYPVPKETLEL